MKRPADNPTPAWPPRRNHVRAGADDGHHSTGQPIVLKLLQLALLLGTCACANAQSTRSATETPLRTELTRLIEAGRTAEAVSHAQTALAANPDDARIVREYVDLHLSLARQWIARHDFAAARAAVSAVRSVQPSTPEARRIEEHLNRLRDARPEHLRKIDRLIELELFDAALEQLDKLAAVEPRRQSELATRIRAARLGVADEHYLARNFNEAFALYESILANDDGDSLTAVRERWVLSLTLALSEVDSSGLIDPDAAGRLFARTLDVLEHVRQPIVGHIIGGLLAERSGHLVDAGQAYARALGAPWSLPSSERRPAAVAALRRRAIDKARALYEDTPTGRRSGMWAIALPDTWKKRESAHFVVYARNDLIAERVIDAAEVHLRELARWLRIEPPTRWDPRCEIRVHATQNALHKATNTRGITYAVSHTRVQGTRVLLRRLDVFQRDAWLLRSTLPHELTHLLVADHLRNRVLPLPLDEALALQAEPPARHLMYGLRLRGVHTPIDRLLRATRLPPDIEGFYAQCATLLPWIAARRDVTATTDSLPETLLQLASDTPDSRWQSLGFADANAAAQSWRDWCATQSKPRRMPLMLRVEPNPKHRTDAYPHNASSPARVP